MLCVEDYSVNVVNFFLSFEPLHLGNSKLSDILFRYAPFVLRFQVEILIT